MNSKKIINSILIIMSLIIIVICFYIGYLIYDTTVTKTIKCDLTQISNEEKQTLIQLNLLDLDYYPESLKFCLLSEEIKMRESQYYIEFSINKKEAYSHIERDNTHVSGMTSIFKIKEDEERIIYRFSTDFSSNSKGKEYDFLNEILNKYKELRS